MERPKTAKLPRERLTTTQISAPPSTQPIDYRTLVQRSRYDQIENELAKLKLRLAALEESHVTSTGKSQARRQSTSPRKSVATETSFRDDENNPNHRLGQALVNIEDDLHRILYILLHQYEMLNRSQRRHTKPLMIQARPESKTSLNNKQVVPPRDIPFQPILRKDSRTKSQPNLARFSTDIAQSPAQSSTAREPIPTAPSHQVRSRSGERRKSSPSQTRFSHDAQLQHCHFHVTKPDVHWILGTSPTPSFSMLARRQMKLAALKQHGPLCLKTYVNPAVDYFDLPEERSRIIHRVQSMINELQLEYDRLYRQLQFQQTIGDEDQPETSKIPTISNHLIHIMDQLVELHQLNKSFLC